MTSSSQLLFLILFPIKIIKIIIADRSLSSFTGKGTIKLTDTISLHSILRVPNLVYNLLSISKLGKDSNCCVNYC